ncbi:MAG: hypothetical protein DRJ60_01175 [Thermoprotei archaeon]|nr:MAG: hypothetical protein DRJ60_01175 [Thermoprotei archaeon]
MRDPKTLQNVASHDYLVTEEEYQYLEERVKQALRQRLIVRKIFADLYTKPLGIGVEEYAYDKETDVGVAEVAYEFKHFTKDLPTVTRGTIQIPILAKMFEIPRRALEASRRLGRPLNTRAANSAAYRVAYLENSIVINGWASDGSNYDINGFYQAANNDYSTSKDFGTAGNAKTAVAGAIALLNADGIYGPYTLLLHPTQFAELAASVISGVGREIDIVKALLAAEDEGGARGGPARLGKIYSCPYLTDGTGLLIGNAPDIAEIVLGEDIQIEVWEKKPVGTEGIVFEAVVPVIYQTDAFCKLSSI